MVFPHFYLKNSTLMDLNEAFFKIGVPCQRGVIPHDSPIVLVANGQPLQASHETTALWPDGSVKWLFIKGLVSVAQSTTVKCEVAIGQPVSPVQLPVVKNRDSQLIITSRPESGGNSSDASALFTLDKSAFLTFDCAERNIYAKGLAINGKQVEIKDIQSVSTHYATKYCNSAPLFVELQQQGRVHINEQPLDISVALTICLPSLAIIGSVTVCNPLPATHPNGQWDLGDPNAFNFQDISLTFDVNNQTLELAADTLDQPYIVKPADNFELFQASSGLDNWNSPVHVDAQNRVSLPFKGFTLTVNDEPELSGQHIQPVVYTTPHAQMPTDLKPGISIDEFWQNFPASIRKKGPSLQLSLLGAATGPATELQPGEQKTRHFALGNNCNSQLEVTLPAQAIQNAGVLPFYHCDNLQLPLQELIQAGVAGQNSFFQKRLKIDEFGWRHYGELYADHETALTPDEPFFVSHYNNQYDPILGMLSQWLLTGDQRWFELGDSLARHVADIDIYHTQNDKPDYSGGLFWHTDHYVQACTATHRTYSKRQPTDVYDDHAGGGGPGGQHCYSSGLLLHYYLTGHAPSKTAVLSLGKWIQTLYEGDNSLIGLLLSIKNRHRADLKSIITGQYPLDRGTGNYIQTLLDCYQLTANTRYLQQAEHVIYHTIAPTDDFAERQLSDVENTWFYTVFLQSVCRFIVVKSQLGQQDAAFQYAVSSLCHYVKWMATNEYLYLDKPDILEFPNQTWSGQDLRKLCVMSFALPFMNDNDVNSIQSTITSMAAELEARLSQSDEKDNTRVLCLMMQNFGYTGYFNTAKDALEALSLQASRSLNSTSSATVPKSPPDSLRRETLKVLSHFSFKHERQQLIRRFPALSKWLGALYV